MNNGVTIGTFKGIDGEGRFTAVANAQTVDRHGEILVSSGCRLDAYRANPVILAEHAPWMESGHSPVIGKTLDIQAGETEVPFVGQFAPTELGEERKALYAGGFMNAFSVGFMYDTWQYEQTETGGQRRRVLAWELLEISTVAVPSNRESLIRAVQKGVGGRTAMSALAMCGLLDAVRDIDGVPLSAIARRCAPAVAGQAAGEPDAAARIDAIQRAVDGVSTAVQKHYDEIIRRFEDLEALVLTDDGDRHASGLAGGVSAHEPVDELARELAALKAQADRRRCV